MDKELKKLNDTVNLELLRNYLKGLSTSTIMVEVPQLVWKNDGPAQLQTMLNGFGNSKACVEKKVQVIECILNEIEQKQLPAMVAEKLVCVLAVEVDSFPSAPLLRLADLCCDMIRYPHSDNKFACWKELLPKLLHVIVGKNSIEHNGTQMTGEEYKNNVVTGICQADWTTGIIVDLAAMFVDMPLNKTERARIVKKLCALLPKLTTEQIPLLSKHLLILTQTENSVVLFLALASYFDDHLYRKMEKGSSDEESAHRSLKQVSDMEGTILYHVVNEPDGCKELLKTIKTCVTAPEFILKPFIVTLLLALSSLSKYEDEVLSTLKTLMQRALLESDRATDSIWLRNFCPPPLDVNKVMSKVLENCFQGRDVVLKGLINLGFHLLSAVRSSDGLHRLGTFILEDMVRRNKLVTGIVLDTLNNYLKQVSDTTQYTDCLHALTRKQALSILECSGDIAKLLDTSLRVNASTGTQILFALLPLARLSHALRDKIVVFLRKAIFPHDVEHRIMSVSGFLELLRDLKISNLRNLSQSMSQNYSNMTQLCSQSYCGGASLSNEGLCLEILTVLREVFKQQHQVKTVLYKGMYSSVRANADLGPHALDYLQTHLERWYIHGDAPLPLKFHETVSIEGQNATLREPLGEFILTLSLVVAKLDDTSRSNQLQEMLDSLCSRMADCDVAHFKLEPEDGQIMDSTPEGMQAQEVLRQILSVYEALLGYLLCSWRKAPAEKAERFRLVFKGHKVLSDYARGLGKLRKKGDKGKQAAFRFPQTVFNFKCCSRLLSVVNNVSTGWAPEESTAQLRVNRELARHACQVTQQIIHEAKIVPAVQLLRDAHNTGYLFSIGRILYTKHVLRIAEMKAFDLPGLLLALQAFVDLLALVLSHFKTKFNLFMKEICGEPQGSQSEVGLKKVIVDLLTQLDDVLEEDAHEREKENMQTKKVSVLYVSIIATMVQQIPPEATYILQVYQTVRTYCLENSSEKPAEAKALVALLLALHRTAASDDDEPSRSLLVDIAASLTENLTLLDIEIDVPNHTPYQVVGTTTGNLVLVALCECLQQHLADIEWAINRLKADLVILKLPSDRSLEIRLGEHELDEAEVCQHLDMVVRSLSWVCIISIPAGVFADAVLRTLELTYNRLTLLAKYYFNKVGKFDEDLQKSKFKDTVRLVESVLTNRAHFLTNHVIQAGTTTAPGVNPNILKNRTLKETKYIPKVILEREQYHKLLLQISKRAKYDLSSKLKLPTTRDYRISKAIFLQAMDDMEDEADEMDITKDDDEGGNASGSDASNAENESPNPKRQRKRLHVTGDALSSSSGPDVL